MWGHLPAVLAGYGSPDCPRGFPRRPDCHPSEPGFSGRSLVHLFLVVPGSPRCPLTICRWPASRRPGRRCSSGPASFCFERPRLLPRALDSGPCRAPFLIALSPCAPSGQTAAQRFLPARYTPPTGIRFRGDRPGRRGCRCSRVPLPSSSFPSVKHPHRVFMSRPTPLEGLASAFARPPGFGAPAPKMRPRGLGAPTLAIWVP